MKVVLINPPQYTKYAQPPMGLATIAGILTREGNQVTIVDANALRLEPGQIPSYLSDADAVGLTAMTPTINAAIKIAREIKQAYPDLPVILGGAHATLLPEETLSTVPEIDIIVRGEAEEIFTKLLRLVESKKPFDNIPGVTWRKNGEVFNNPSRPANTDLDALPFLAYHLLPWQRYKPHPPHGRALPFIAIITSRGCPYQCAYCSKPIFGNEFRAQSPERVLEEIAYFKKKYGTREIAFYDDIFTLDKKRAYAIADGLIKKDFKIYWTCETRVNLVDKDLLQHMKRAGCYAIAYGIESASQDILNILHKGITCEQVESAIRLTHEAGLQTIGYFMIGSPSENRQTIIQTIDFAKKLKLDFAQFAITTPFPGTKLYELSLDSKKDDVSWDDYLYEGTGNKLTPVFEVDGLSRMDLQNWVRKAYREFYLRPSYIWQRIRRMKSFGDLRVNLKGFLMLLNSVKK